MIEILLAELRKQVMLANIQLETNGLVIYTWGNVSAIDQASKLVVIKPSGIPYHNLTPEKMVIVDLKGLVVEGNLRPSSDLPTHLELYRSFPNIGAVAHTHSCWATAWAQAGEDIPCKGTTHADYFLGEIPCTRALTKEEVANNYELNTGKVIVERMAGLNYAYTPAVLVAEHGPFTWGKDAFEAVYHSTVLETVAKMAFITRCLKGNSEPMSEYIMEKHHLRKHGPSAYYGQATS